MEELEERIRAEALLHEGKPLALSGGIDSGLLAAIMRPKFVISVRLPGGEKYDETKWAQKVAEYLRLKHIIVDTEDSKFDEYTAIAVKAIGRPIPHFNIFPLFCMYKKLHELGETELILGDGPDETMCGYGRDLIIEYLYKVYEMEAFEHYKPIIDKILPRKSDAIKLLTGLDGFVDVVSADIVMRKDMDDMSNGIAAYFGVKNIRPYQDNPEMDNFMRDLPMDKKIDGEFGKLALREIAQLYLPPEVAWRKKKVGGPVYPVNLFKGWDKTEGEFGKASWLEHQIKILS